MRLGCKCTRDSCYHYHNVGVCEFAFPALRCGGLGIVTWNCTTLRNLTRHDLVVVQADQSSVICMQDTLHWLLPSHSAPTMACLRYSGGALCTSVSRCSMSCVGSYAALDFFSGGSFPSPLLDALVVVVVAHLRRVDCSLAASPHFSVATFCITTCRVAKIVSATFGGIEVPRFALCLPAPPAAPSHS